MDQLTATQNVLYANVSDITREAAAMFRTTGQTSLPISDVLEGLRTSRFCEDTISTVLGSKTSNQYEFFTQHKSFKYHSGTHVLDLTTTDDDDAVHAANDLEYVYMCSEKLTLLVTYLEQMGGAVNTTMANSFIEFDVERLKPLMDGVVLLSHEPSGIVVQLQSRGGGGDKKKEVTQLEFETLYKTVAVAHSNGDGGTVSQAFRRFCDNHGPFPSWKLSYKDTEIVTRVYGNPTPSPRSLYANPPS
jgi:hypothetical protein